MSRIKFLSAISFLVAFNLAILFKILHFPGAGILLVLSSFIFLILYVPFQLIQSFKLKKSTLDVIFYLSRTGLLILAMMVITTRLMRWPIFSGVNALFLTLLGICLISYFAKRYSSELNTSEIIDDIIIAYLGVFSFVLMLNAIMHYW